MPWSDNLSLGVVFRAAILFVVEERTINICDQRFHEFQIYQQRPGIKVLRRTHGELVTKATLSADRRLMV